MSSNHLFTYTKTDNAFVTLELCKLHKIDMSYLCIFDDVVYISMRIEIYLSINHNKILMMYDKSQSNF